MIADKSEKEPVPSRRLLPWLNIALVALLLALGLWYLSGKVSLADILDALRLADPLPIIAGLAIMLLTVLLKAWRWQFMFSGSGSRPAFTAVFWSLMLGQYVNLIVPFLRLGEVARIYALNKQSDVSMAQSVGTLVVEKVLDLFILVLMIAVLMPLVVLPAFVARPGPVLWLAPLFALLALFVLAFQADKIGALLQRVSSHVSRPWIQRPLDWAISGLQGLSALRSGRTSAVLVALTVLIAMMSVLLPYVLFGAFDFALTLVQAALLHVVVTIATSPPSTPGKVGVFNGAVALLLYSLGLQDDAAIIGYSIVFHLVVIVPQILLGSIAAAKTDWRWERSIIEEGQLT